MSNNIYSVQNDNMVTKQLASKPMARSTAYARKNGRPSIADKAETQEYLNREEKQTLLASIRTQLHASGCIRSGRVRTLATDIRHGRLSTRHDSTATRRPKPPGKNWPTFFLRAHADELRIRKAQGIGWLMVDADFTPQPADFQHLCASCASIKLRLDAVISRRPNDSRKIYTFQPSKGGIEAVSCKLCVFVQMCGKSWGWPVAGRVSMRIHHMDSVFGPTLAESKVLLSLCVEDGSLAKRYQGWIVPTLLGDEDGMAELSTWGQLKKTVDFDRLREWLMFCNQHHLTDCRMQTLDEIPFFWLIDCATRSIITAPDQAAVQYVALSYCWGPPSDGPLDNPSELPPVAALVIEDALKVACELGIPYLWVDRYCVSQSIRSIQAPQLQNMHKVYRSAYVTIVAGCGQDPDFGLPGVTIRARKPQVSVHTHGHRLTCIPDVQHEIHTCRWSTRGWTYQENLLSKRRLVFTESQVYFQCWNMHCSESTPLRLDDAHTKNRTRFKESIATLRVFPQKGIGKTSREVVARIQEYLTRRFSKDTDALNAFLGVYEAFKELEHPIYSFWGLPISASVRGAGAFGELHMSFLAALAWSMSACDQPSAHLLTRRNMFPSWTWAAWDGLGGFLPKLITDTRHAPGVSLRTSQGRLVPLGDFTRALGSGNSAGVFEPCVYLTGWVGRVRLERSGDSGFEVSAPVQTRRVGIVAGADTAASLSHHVSTGAFEVLLMGSDATREDGSEVSSAGLADVHALVLQAGPDGTHTRLGVVTWSRLGEPSFDETSGVMRMSEIVEARRIVPECRCRCDTSRAASFDYYLEHPEHVLEFRKKEIRLV